MFYEGAHRVRFCPPAGKRWELTVWSKLAALKLTSVWTRATSRLNRRPSPLVTSRLRSKEVENGPEVQWVGTSPRVS